MVNVLVSSAVNNGSSYMSGQTKDYWYNIGICYFTPKHTALRSNNKDWLALNQDNVSERTEGIQVFVSVS